MQHISTPPAHGRGLHAPSRKPPTSPPTTEKDTRWRLLDLVRTCRSRLNLRDRDIAVLRGLLTLVPAHAAAGQTVVFASNRVLIERCDGIDERTLRRRIAHLQACGLIQRRTSPNGKRYQVRDDQNETRLIYGIDLCPLFQIEPHLLALADDCRREALRIKALRAQIRDALFNKADDTETKLSTNARKALRRRVDSHDLQQVLDQMLVESGCRSHDLTGSGGQNDRHIQSSNEDNFESETKHDDERIEDLTKTSQATPAFTATDITVSECRDLAASATSMAMETPQNWEDLIRLSASLAPAIGVKPELVHAAERHLGRHGCALAILGLVEAFDRVRNPAAYLSALIKQRTSKGLDLVRMFRSLVRPPGKWKPA